MPVDLTDIKSRFQDADKPDGADFSELIDIATSYPPPQNGYWVQQAGVIVDGVVTLPVGSPVYVDLNGNYALASNASLVSSQVLGIVGAVQAGAFFLVTGGKFSFPPSTDFSVLIPSDSRLGIGNTYWVGGDAGTLSVGNADTEGTFNTSVFVAVSATDVCLKITNPVQVLPPDPTTQPTPGSDAGIVQSHIYNPYPYENARICTVSRTGADFATGSTTAGNEFYIGGGFTSCLNNSGSKITPNRLLRYNCNTSKHDLAFTTPGDGCNEYVFSCPSANDQSGHVFVGGRFSGYYHTVNGARIATSARLVRLYPATTTNGGGSIVTRAGALAYAAPTTFQDGVSSWVSHIEPIPATAPALGGCYVVGLTRNSSNYGGIRKFDGNLSKTSSFVAGGNGNGFDCFTSDGSWYGPQRVRLINTTDSNSPVVVCGRFTTYGGSNAVNLCILGKDGDLIAASGIDRSTFSYAGMGSTRPGYGYNNGFLDCVVVPNTGSTTAGKIYAVGRFNNINNATNAYSGYTGYSGVSQTFYGYPSICRFSYNLTAKTLTLDTNWVITNPVKQPSNTPARVISGTINRVIRLQTPVVSGTATNIGNLVLGGYFILDVGDELGSGVTSAQTLNGHYNLAMLAVDNATSFGRLVPAFIGTTAIKVSSDENATILDLLEIPRRDATNNATIRGNRIIVSGRFVNWQQGTNTYAARCTARISAIDGSLDVGADVGQA